MGFIFQSRYQFKYKFWLAASILIAILFSLSGLSLAFQSDYTIQDDARQHVFWLQQLNNSNLFPNDLIAHYFSSVAPQGYKILYEIGNFLGLEPFLFNKILPLLLGITTTLYIFLVTIEILPIPLAGFLASLLLNQNLWMLDDLVSGTPRSFFYVLFLGFIYYLLRQSLLPCLLFIILQGLFYPQVVLISAAVSALNLITGTKAKYFHFICLLVAITILAIYKLQIADFNQVINLETAKKLPEFYPGGRSTFFLDNSWSFWLAAQRSGFFPREWQYVLLSSFGLLLPVITKYSHIFTLAPKIQPKIIIIKQILLASVCLFCLAHGLLFSLHLPSRYSQHTWRIVIALVDGIMIAIILDWLMHKVSRYGKILQPLIIAIAISILLYPTYAVQSYPERLGYVTGKTPELYQFLQQQPKNVLIASLNTEANFIPSLAQRSVLTAEEYSIPYHLDYYRQIRHRTQDLIEAQYTLNQIDLDQFIQQYQINLWLVDKNAFTTSYLPDNSWLKPFQLEIKKAITVLQRGKKPIISQKIDQCAIFQTKTLDLLDTQCIISKK